ncbi:uncharacterized protein LOC131218106 [Magnolia sinica]|uniref:uncharacterized protein LOC131218106 n=1 Tax=Magnolia sinica TaxID=86752 RepID=UPI002658F0A0|nr:uncharacterized protein LOC131218106 [Magnolia sinica]
MIEEVDEENLGDESSTSSFEGTTAAEYEDDEDDKNGEDKDDDFKEGEVNIDGEEDVAAENDDKEHPPIDSETLPIVNIPAKSLAIIEEEEEPLYYGEYGYSPGTHVVNARTGDTPPMNPPTTAPVISQRVPLVPLVAPKVVAHEIIFPVETTNLPTPTTRDSSTEARAPSFADMLGAGPSTV